MIRSTPAPPDDHVVTRLRWITLAIWLLWTIVYWNGGRRGVDDIRRAWQTRASHRDLIAMLGIVVFTLPLIGSILRRSLRRGRALPPTAGPVGTLIGVVLTGGGVIGMSIARAHLGHFWTAEAAIQPDHRVVSDGPYSRVRHPIYTSALAVYGGTALVYPTRSNLLLTLLLFISYIVKADAEEALLIEHLPEYADYRRNVPYRMLPGLW